MTLHISDPMNERALIPNIDTYHPALQGLLADGTPSDDRIHGFLGQQDVPLVRPGRATFLWHGTADAVELLRWIHGGVDRHPFIKVKDANLWVLELPVEDEGRFEYKLNIVQSGHEGWMLDSLNTERAGDPFGENSVCLTHGYARPDWSEAQGAPAGAIVSIYVASEVFNETRVEQVYLPAGFDAARTYPLVVIHDGADFVTYADLSTSLDNLIAAGDIPPVIVALVQSGDRMSEYPKGRRHARYLVQELLPAVERDFNISADPADRILLGASLGAVVSLATAFRYPGVFGGLVLKSGSFILDADKLKGRDHPVFHRVAALVRAIKRAPLLPGTRAFVSTGELEGLADENRALADLLAGRGVDVQFQSAWDGHHWHNWRDQLRDALMWVLREEKTPD